MSDANSPPRPREWWIVNDRLTNPDHPISKAYRFCPNLLFPIVHVVEHSALESAQAEIATLKGEVTALRQGIPKVPTHYEKVLQAEIERLKNQMVNEIREGTAWINNERMKQSALLTELAEALEGMGRRCVNIGQYGPIKISPGECVCSSCKAKDALEKYEKHKRGESK